MLESVSSREQGHTEDWIETDIERVMAAHFKTTFSGAFTDNISSNWSDGSILQRRILWIISWVVHLTVCICW